MTLPGDPLPPPKRDGQAFAESAATAWTTHAAAGISRLRHNHAVQASNTHRLHLENHVLRVLKVRVVPRLQFALERLHAAISSIHKLCMQRTQARI